MPAFGITTASHALSGYLERTLAALLVVDGTRGDMPGPRVARRFAGGSRTLDGGLGALAIAVGVYVPLRSVRGRLRTRGNQRFAGGLRRLRRCD